MAPHKSRPSYLGLSAEEKKNIPMPDKFRCRDCYKMKEPQMFSNKEHKSYFDKYLASPANRRINGITAKIRCRSCSGEQVNELQCEGQCGKWKSLDQFSKAQRTRGSKWCQECVLWKESTEPGVVTQAPPNTMLAPDEADREGVDDTTTVTHGEGVSWSYVNVAGGNDDSDDDYNFTSAVTYPSTVQTPYVALQAAVGSLNLNEQPTTNSTGGRETSHVADNPPSLRNGTGITNTMARGYVPPHLRGDNSSSLVDTNSSGYIPPHMRGITSMAPGEGTPSDISSLSNRHITRGNGDSAPSNSESVDPSARDPSNWAAVDARRRHGQPVAKKFIGYDNTGQPHTQQRVPSTQNSAVASPQVTPADRGNSGGNSRGNWAKAIGTKAPKVVYQKTGGWKAPEYNSDSDNSHDEV